MSLENIVELYDGNLAALTEAAARDVRTFAAEFRRKVRLVLRNMHARVLTK